MPASAIDGAILWYVRLAANPSDDAQESAFTDWHRADPNHAEAWQRVEALRGKMVRTLSAVPSPVARDVLGACLPSSGRRRMLKTLAWAGTGSAGLWLLREPLGISQQWQIATADLRTPTGQRRSVNLPDGSLLHMNTASAVDLRFDQDLRLLILRQGDIEITTAPDLRMRPFVVQVPDARLTPVGTRFGVSLRKTDTLLTVSQGAVDLSWRKDPGPLRVPAGRQVRFDSVSVDAVEALDDSAIAWTDGQIRANRMLLGDFLAELARYQPGWLRCDPSIATLRITAIHALEGPDSVRAVLETLPRTLPVRVRHVSPWLTLVGPSSA